MNSEQAYELIGRYANRAAVWYARKKDSSTVQRSSVVNMKYVAQMVERASSEFPEDKANRWVGFIQGVLWAERVFDLESLKAHVRASKDLVEKVHTEICQGAVLEDRCV